MPIVAAWAFRLGLFAEECGKTKDWELSFEFLFFWFMDGIDMVCKTHYK